MQCLYAASHMLFQASFLAPALLRVKAKAGALSGFYGSIECLKNISDIQCQTGEPITMPTASVAIK